MKQVLFCLETNKRANTDYSYIKKTIEHYCDLSDKSISFRPIYMGSKHKYNSRDVERDIKKYKNNYKGDTNIVYCIDLDQWDSDPKDADDLNKIKAFCAEKGFDYVFFGRDIENVYLGKTVPDSEKVKKASQFAKNNDIETFDSSILKASVEGVRKSNLLLVLKKHFTLKKID